MSHIVIFSNIILYEHRAVLFYSELIPKLAAFPLPNQVRGNGSLPGSISFLTLEASDLIR
jgi:hypothetical protein